MPVFMCGGGSEIALYKRATQKVGQDYDFIKQLDFLPLPKPEGLNAAFVPEEEYHRIAVAYGLSFDYDDIGRTIPPDEVPDIEPRIKDDIADRDTSKDEVLKNFSCLSEE